MPRTQMLQQANGGDAEVNMALVEMLMERPRYEVFEVGAHGAGL